jgi:hypothetical protein
MLLALVPDSQNLAFACLEPSEGRSSRSHRVAGKGESVPQGAGSPFPPLRSLLNIDRGGQDASSSARVRGGCSLSLESARAHRALRSGRYDPDVVVVEVDLDRWPIPVADLF